MYQKAADGHMLLRMIRESKMSSDWFWCVLVIPFYVAKMFSESVTKSSSCFANVYLFAISASYAIDDAIALAIRASDLLNALARCNFHSSRKMPHISKIYSQLFTHHLFVSVSRNYEIPFCGELSSPVPFTRRLLRIVYRVWCFISILSSTLDTPWIYSHISEFAYIPRMETLESTLTIFPSRKNYTKRP